MKYFSKLGELSDRFEIKLSLAQTSAQAGDIDRVLREAGVFPTAEAIAPYLNTAKIPDNTAVNIGSVIDRALNVKFKVATSPSNPAGNVLARLLDSKFASPMVQALKQAKVSVADTIELPIATFS
jgi:hypothetical protein